MLLDEADFDNEMGSLFFDSLQKDFERRKEN